MNEYMVFTDDRCPGTVMRWPIEGSVLPAAPADGFKGADNHFTMDVSKPDAGSTLTLDEARRFISSLFDELAKSPEFADASKTEGG